MNTNSHPASDREALSALFDGELVGDAARFALKRLDHDQDWRDTCNRWQHIGDAMRGQGAMLPLAFHERVRAAVRNEVAVAAVPARRTGRVRWGSVGLAASAAVVAFFLARMPIGTQSQDAATPQVATATTQATPQPQPAHAPAQPDPDAQQASAAVAIAAVARPIAERVTQRSRAVARGRAATDRVVSTVVASRAPVTGEAPPAEPTVIAANTIAEEQPSPRQWPRAVLPQLDGTGAVVTSYATGTEPSFYPFHSRPVLAPANDDPHDAPAPAAAAQP